MSAQEYWSVEECRWVRGAAAPGLHWSVQRCRWEPPGPEADALATPWSMFAARAGGDVPEQRAPYEGSTTRT